MIMFAFVVGTTCVLTLSETAVIDEAREQNKAKLRANGCHASAVSAADR